MATLNKSELIPVLEQFERDKGIPKEDILHMIEHALVSAYRKHHGQQVNMEAAIDPGTGEIRAFVVKAVVEEVKDPYTEVTATQAKGLHNAVQAEGVVKIPVDATEFARIAAQTAKQVLIQKIRETERESLYDEYKPKEGILVNGQVHRFVNRNIIVDLGRAEAILPAREQVRRERWVVGDRIRAMILKVERGMRGPEVVLSRAHPDFVRRLFEQEVPEVYEKTVEVLQVVREPGLRSKVVVKSSNPKVDPIGACVGVKGSRVRPIINELQGERIDLVAHAAEAAAFIANALSPVKPLLVNILSHEQKRAEALVADDQLSLAIGKGGQNVRLAAKLTGWQLDVRSQTQKREASLASAQALVQELSQLDGVGPKTADILQKGGWGVARLAEANPSDLTGLSGIGDKTAEKIVESAKAFLAQKAVAAASAPAAEPAAPEEAAPTEEGAGDAEQTPSAEEQAS